MAGRSIKELTNLKTVVFLSKEIELRTSCFLTGSLNNKELAEKLFLLGVDVESINIDEYGIIKHFKKLEREKESICALIKDNHAYYVAALNDKKSYVESKK